MMNFLVMAAVLVSLVLCRDLACAEQGSSPERNRVEAKQPTTRNPQPATPVQTDAGLSGSAVPAPEHGSDGAEAKKPEPEPDRRWIIKMKDEKGRKLPARKPVAIAWAGKEQQTRCEAYLPRLMESFSKTRYYSVGGDGCNTAGSAGAFLDLVKSCEGDCPQGFLEAKGYSQQILRNVEILHQLGRKKCLESTQETGTGVKSARPEAQGSRSEVRGTRPEDQKGARSKVHGARLQEKKNRQDAAPPGMEMK